MHKGFLKRISVSLHNFQHLFKSLPCVYMLCICTHLFSNYAPPPHHFPSVHNNNGGIVWTADCVGCCMYERETESGRGERKKEIISIKILSTAYFFSTLRKNITISKHTHRATDLFCVFICILKWGVFSTNALAIHSFNPQNAFLMYFLSLPALLLSLPLSLYLALLSFCNLKTHIHKNNNKHHHQCLTV